CAPAIAARACAALPVHAQVARQAAGLTRTRSQQFSAQHHCSANTGPEGHQYRIIKPFRCTSEVFSNQCQPRIVLSLAWQSEPGLAPSHEVEADSVVILSIRCEYRPVLMNNRAYAHGHSNHLRRVHSTLSCQGMKPCL